MRRVIIAVALICAFVILAAYYQANVTQHLDYARESEVSANYAKYRRTARHNIGQRRGDRRSVLRAQRGEQHLYDPLVVDGSAARGCRYRRRHARARKPAARARRFTCHQRCSVFSSTSARLSRSSSWPFFFLWGGDLIGEGG